MMIQAEDWISLEAKLSKGDVLVHIVLGLVHPRQLDLSKNVFLSFQISQFLYLLVSEPKTLKLDLAILFIHWEPYRLYIHTKT